jgi:hypothetical protein
LSTNAPAALLDARLVHEARVEVADLARLGAGLRRPGLLDDLAHGLLGLLGEHVEGAVAGLVVGDRRAVDPLPVDVAEQVVLRADPRVQFGGLDAGCGGFAHEREPRTAHRAMTSP